jgi:sarcosine oxidase delta subunit
MSTSPTRVARPAQARATDDVERYLRALFARESPDAFIEVRYRHHDDMRRHFFKRTDTFAAARTIARLGLRSDVYVGVAARRSKHAGGKDAIRRVWTLWADLDDVDADQRLDELHVAPAILIASGSAGHRHAYWPLARPVSIAAAETANRRLAAQLHADTGAVTNAATILRPLSVGAASGGSFLPARSLGGMTSSDRAGHDDH